MTYEGHAKKEAVCYSLDPRIAKAIRDEAIRRGVQRSVVAGEIIAAGLAAYRAARGKPVRGRTCG